MTVHRTEQSSDLYRDLDIWPSAKLVAAIAAAQGEAVASVAAAGPAIATVGEIVAARLRAGGRLVYVGAGSSGLIAQLDALELPGTYGIPADRVPVVLAGGAPALAEIPGGAEDDTAAAEAAITALAVGPRDVVLGLSASGRTPFVLAALAQARRRGAATVGIANNAGTPLLTEVDHAILLATPPEVIAGSTRMNAGTAQKCALNILSTLVGVRLGHAYDGMMVNLRADNDKLRRRAAGIVARAAGRPAEAAEAALEAAGGEVKLAIVLCAGASGPDEARAILATHGDDVRASLAALAAQQKKAG